jgi:hypothetical protein
MSPIRLLKRRGDIGSKKRPRSPSHLVLSAATEKRRSRSLYCNSNETMKVVVVVVVVHVCSSVVGGQEDIIKKRQTYTSRVFGGLGATRDTHTKELNI